MPSFKFFSVVFTKLSYTLPGSDPNNKNQQVPLSSNYKIPMHNTALIIHTDSALVTLTE